MVKYKTHKYPFFSRWECWFYDGREQGPKGYTAFSAATQVCEGRKASIEKYKTTVHDLSQSEEKLFNAIHTTFRYDIRQAEKTSVAYSFIHEPTAIDCHRLAEAYNLFAKEVGLAPMKIKSVLAAADAGALTITLAKYEGKEIVTHIYINDEKNVILMSSFHAVSFTDKKIRSECNKYLHWKDLLLFKNANKSQYDFGGINMEKLPGISKFKLAFGGREEERYRYVMVPAFLFPIIKALKKWRS